MQSKSDDQWNALRKRIAAVIDGETDTIAKMASIACELFHSDERFDWVGFYRVTEPEVLKIGPYQGGHGCLVIPFGKGVCGACAKSRKTLVVDDVNTFPGHIACSTSTCSEIVLPVFDQGELIAVLDIDSDLPAAFNELDRIQLESLLADSFQ